MESRKTEKGVRKAGRERRRSSRSGREVRFRRERAWRRSGGSLLCGVRRARRLDMLFLEGVWSIFCGGFLNSEATVVVMGCGEVYEV